jgi:amino acid transporter
LAIEKLKRALGFRDLLLFYVVSGLSLRWIATAAAAGPATIGVWVLALIGFFVPLAGCVLELSSRYPDEGGLYVWTREAFGDFPAFMAAWLYWMSNLPYFSGVLFFAASSLLFVGHNTQSLADSHLYFMIFTVVILGLVTVLNVIGLNIGKWINNLGAIGMVIPVLLLIGLGAISLTKFGSATRFTLHGLIPRAGVKDLVFWSTIFFAFSGCECASFMGDEIDDTRRVVPKALIAGGFILAVGYIAGTVAMLIALPSSSISGLGGFMTAIAYLSTKLGFGVLIAPIAVLVAVGNVGAVSAYLSSTARLPFVAGVDRYLPPVFGRIHPRWKTPYVALISYGIAAVLFALLSEAGTSVKGAYDVLVSMGIITYFIPYIFLFAAMIRVQSRPASPRAVLLPGGKWTAIPLAIMGLISTTGTIIMSLFPAEDDAHPVSSLVKILVMTFVLIAAGAGIYWYNARTHRVPLLLAEESE